MTFYIYKITNLVNGKIYFGKTNNIKKRWASHKTSALAKCPNDYSYLHRSMNKYGFDNFKLEQVADFASENETLEAEIEFIKKYNTKDRNIGYNLTNGGDGASGYRFSEEQKQKMSENRKGKRVGKQNSFYGRKHSEEFKSKHSEYMKTIYQENKEKYDSLNAEQCFLTEEQCIEIQQKIFNGKYFDGTIG